MSSVIPVSAWYSLGHVVVLVRELRAVEEQLQRLPLASDQGGAEHDERRRKKRSLHSRPPFEGLPRPVRPGYDVRLSYRDGAVNKKPLFARATAYAASRCRGAQRSFSFHRYSVMPLCEHILMGITQKEIAHALELPLITVHRALNNSGYVSKELKGRILAYARDVRYVPHKASQVLKRNKVRKIAVFSSSLPHYFWNDIRTGISIGAEQIQPLNYRVNYHMIAERDSEHVP